MGVFGKLFKHSESDQKPATDFSPEQDPLAGLEVSGQDNLPPQTLSAVDIPLQSGSSTQAPKPTPSTSDQISSSYTQDHPAFEVPISDSLSRPHEYDLGPEPIHEEVHEQSSDVQQTIPAQVSTDATGTKKELPSFDKPQLPQTKVQKPVHMKDKIHVPVPEANELIVKEVYVERDHFIELLSALHIARNDLEKELTARLNLDQTNTKMQTQLQRLQSSFEEMQKHALHVEAVIAQEQR